MMKKTRLFVSVLAVCLLGLSGNLVPHTGSYAAGDFYAYLPNVNQQFRVGFGSVEGAVYEATSGDSLTNVPVCFEGVCVNTDASGGYIHPGIPTGWRDFTASGDGLNPITQTANVIYEETTQLNFYLSWKLNEGEYRIVLSWDDKPSYHDPDINPYEGEDIPNDMDAHLWIPNPGSTPDPLHVYWATKDNLDISNCDAFPFSCLEWDFKYGGGPESIMIVPLQPGVYTYAVQYYADYIDVNGVVPPLTNSQAKVQVYDFTGLIKTYYVPTTGEGVWWHVFDVDGVNAGEIIDRNEILNDSPGPMSAPF